MSLEQPRRNFHASAGPGLARLRICTPDPQRFAHPLWSAAAKNRDLIAHHYEVIDPDELWDTVVQGFPRLADVVVQARKESGS